MKEQIISTFNTLFKEEPLVVFSPGRINLIGEHTDYNNGFVFPAAIDKGIYMGISASENDNCIVHAMDNGKTCSFSLNDIKPVLPSNWKNYIFGVISEIQKITSIPKGVRIVFKGDIPIGAGLSSSAALENAVVFGLNELFDLQLSKEQMIQISQQAEHNFVGVKCGIMDQFASMFGKEQSALLLDCKTLESTTYKIDFNNYAFLLINTNVSHNLAESAYNKRRDTCERVARALKKVSLRDISLEELNSKKSLFSTDDFQKALFVLEENNRVLEASHAIQNNDLSTLGALLYQSHEGLSNQYEVSCEELDLLVASTKNNSNILGARMMGGGFGGCTINLIKKDYIPSFSEHIKTVYRDAFKKDCSIYQVNLSNGTHII